MKENCLIIILIMSFALIVPTIAEQENLAFGPYKVSFDMGIDDLMDWVVHEPINSESMDGSLTYTQYIADVAILTESQFVSESKRLGHAPDSNYAAIYVTHYNTTQNLSATGTRKAVEAALSNYIDRSVNERTIDGRPGTIGSGTSTSTSNTMYVAGWWMDNNTDVYVVSLHPWDEGTLSLLKTIHIEKSNATT